MQGIQVRFLKIKKRNQKAFSIGKKILMTHYILDSDYSQLVYREKEDWNKKYKMGRKKAENQANIHRERYRQWEEERWEKPGDN